MMKKHLLSLAIAILGTIALQAQTSLVAFTYNGNLLSDGTKLTFNDVEEDIFGDKQVKLPIKVKNLTSEELSVVLSVEIISIDNGALQVCFPKNCVQYKKIGNYSDSGTMESDAESDIRTEWLCGNDYGEVHAKFTINVQGNSDAEASTIDVTLTNKGLTPVQLPMSNNREVARYSLSGTLQQGECTGLTIIKYEDGTTRKVLMPRE